MVTWHTFCIHSLGAIFSLGGVAVVGNVSCGGGCSVDRGLCSLLTVGKDLVAYTGPFKLRVVAYAEEHWTLKATGRKFGVNDKCVRRWCNQKGQLAATNQTRKSFPWEATQVSKTRKNIVEYVTSTF